MKRVTLLPFLSFASLICDTIAHVFASPICNFLRHDLLSFIYWEICSFLRWYAIFAKTTFEIYSQFEEKKIGWQFSIKGRQRRPKKFFNIYIFICIYVATYQKILDSNFPFISTILSNLTWNLTFKFFYKWRLSCDSIYETCNYF